MSLNLTQKRQVQDFQKFYEEWRKQFNQTIGFEIPIEVKWDDFFHGSDNTSPETMRRCWENIYFTSLQATFAKVCSDDMGRTAVKEKIKKVLIHPNPGKSSAHNTFDIRDGAVIIDHNPRNNDHAIEQRTAEWSKKLEENL